MSLATVRLRNTHEVLHLSIDVVRIHRAVDADRVDFRWFGVIPFKCVDVEVLQDGLICRIPTDGHDVERVDAGSSHCVEREQKWSMFNDCNLL